MARRKKKQEEHIDESWLIPYSDMLTLLLALFIVLFAVSEVDATKFKQIAGTFKDQFSSGNSIIEQQAPLPMPKPMHTAVKDNFVMVSVEEKGRIEKVQEEMESLQKVQERIEQYIKDKKLGKSLQTQLTENGLLITILDNALFESGSSSIKAGSVQIGKDLSKLLVTNPPRNIIIAGHTDNVPIQNSQYQSNWELSSIRAINFMQILMTNPELSPKTLSASGYGEFRPRATNHTAEGKAKNRRVEVLILPNYSMKNKNKG